MLMTTLTGSKSALAEPLSKTTDAGASAKYFPPNC